MAEKYTLTIYIAEDGTPMLDKDDRHQTGETSLAGHMWYGIQKGDGPVQTYGFQSKNGVPSGLGEVVKTDNSVYYKPRHIRTMEISKEHYERAKDYGENGLHGRWNYIDSTYNVLTNSCVDFTWGALKHMGLLQHQPEIKFTHFNGDVYTILESNDPIPANFDGEMKPIVNQSAIDSLIDPFPNSPLNRIQHNPTAKETAAELLATARPTHSTNEVEQPVLDLHGREPLKKNIVPLVSAVLHKAPTNRQRFLTAHTPLGDALWAVSLTGREALSSLYHFTVRFKSDSANIDCQALIGERCAIELATEQGGPRYLSGQMIDFAAIGQEGRHWTYEASVAPKLWHASRRADFRIWQNQSVSTILDQVLGENAVRFDMRLKSHYKPRDYLVQYRETDLSFICRQLEHEGIFFWFEHRLDGETLVLADHFTTHPDCPGYASVPYYNGMHTRPDRDHFDQWRLTRRVELGRFIHSDYDFERPSSDLTTEHADPRGHLFDHYTRFHYPGDYRDIGQGNQYAANALERLQGEQETVHLSGRVRGAAPGHRLRLTEHPRADQNRELTLVAATYDITDSDDEARPASIASQFRIEVQAIPATRPFRPPLTTPKPRSRGVETATVVGPPGEEIYTDAYGRIKVHFHWDRYGKRDGSDTCWIRVASSWAGSNFGAITIPRIGQEVIVDFEYGDPDRPIITGCVYNAEHMPPWSLPLHQTQSGILTRSSKGGAAGAGQRDGMGDANALRFEDKKGQEQLWLHAQKDCLIEVEHDQEHWVGQDRKKTIDRDERSTIARDRSEVVGRNEKITVHGERDVEVDLDETLTVHKNRHKTVDAHANDRIGQNWTVDVGQHLSLQAGASITLKVGDSALVMSADGSITLNGHDYAIALSGQKIVKAQGNIILKGAKILEN